MNPELLKYLALVSLSIIAGIMVKLSDFVEDSVKKKDSIKIVRVLLGLAYGTNLFVIYYLFNDVAPLWIGIILGLLIYGKIDAMSHYIGVGIFFLLVFFTGSVGYAAPLLTVMFTLICLAEEFVNDYFDRHPIKNKIFATLISVRPLLEISSFVTSLLTGQWMMWLGLVGHDVGYVFISVIEKKYLNNKT
jgi:hypothetical protein